MYNPMSGNRFDILDDEDEFPQLVDEDPIQDPDNNVCK